MILRVLLLDIYGAILILIEKTGLVVHSHLGTQPGVGAHTDFKRKIKS